MNAGNAVLAFDVGTTTLKAALIETGRFKTLLKTGKPSRILYPKHGWAEQDLEELWQDLAGLAREILEEYGQQPIAVGFTAHMAGVVPVDIEGRPLRNAIIWLDERAEGYPRSLWRGFPKIYGYNLRRLLKFLRITGGAPGKTGKDPLSKLHWLMENEPDTFNSAYKFLDVKGYLLARATGEMVTTHDEASLTWLADTRHGKAVWHPGLLREYSIPGEKLPSIVDSTSIVGRLKEDAARDLGVEQGLPVVAGAGDMTAAGLGSGAVKEGEAHIYVGTSDWIAAHVSRRLLDISHYIGSIMSAVPGKYFVVAEQEVAGGALEWFMELSGVKSNYNYVEESLEDVGPGESGLLFAPWFYGERAPIDDAFVRGILLNISLSTSRRDIIRAIIDGIVLNIKWAYGPFEKLVRTQESVRIVGGLSLLEGFCRSLASAIRRPVLRVEKPQDAGLRGVAMLASVGLGLYSSLEEAAERISIEKKFRPDEETARVYDKLLRHYKDLYRKNKRLFRKLNSGD